MDNSCLMPKVQTTPTNLAEYTKTGERGTWSLTPKAWLLVRLSQLEMVKLEDGAPLQGPPRISTRESVFLNSEVAGRSHGII